MESPRAPAWNPCGVCSICPILYFVWVVSVMNGLSRSAGRLILSSALSFFVFAGVVGSAAYALEPGEGGTADAAGNTGGGASYQGGDTGSTNECAGGGGGLHGGSCGGGGGSSGSSTAKPKPKPTCPGPQSCSASSAGKLLCLAGSTGRWQSYGREASNTRWVCVCDARPQLCPECPALEPSQDEWFHSTRTTCWDGSISKCNRATVLKDANGCPTGRECNQFRECPPRPVCPPVEPSDAEVFRSWRVTCWDGSISRCTNGQRIRDANRCIVDRVCVERTECPPEPVCASPPAQPVATCSGGAASRCTRYEPVETADGCVSGYTCAQFESCPLDDSEASDLLVCGSPASVLTSCGKRTSGTYCAAQTLVTPAGACARNQCSDTRPCVGGGSSGGTTSPCSSPGSVLTSCGGRTSGTHCSAQTLITPASGCPRNQCSQRSACCGPASSVLGSCGSRTSGTACVAQTLAANARGCPVYECSRREACCTANPRHPRMTCVEGYTQYCARSAPVTDGRGCVTRHRCEEWKPCAVDRPVCSPPTSVLTFCAGRTSGTVCDSEREVTGADGCPAFECTSQRACAPPCTPAVSAITSCAGRTSGTACESERAVIDADGCPALECTSSRSCAPSCGAAVSVVTSCAGRTTGTACESERAVVGADGCPTFECTSSRSCAPACGAPASVITSCGTRTSGTSCSAQTLVTPAGGCPRYECSQRSACCGPASSVLGSCGSRTTGTVCVAQALATNARGCPVYECSRSEACCTATPRRPRMTCESGYAQYCARSTPVTDGRGCVARHTCEEWKHCDDPPPPPPVCSVPESVVTSCEGRTSGSACESERVVIGADGCSTLECTSSRACAPACETPASVITSCGTRTSGTYCAAQTLVTQVGACARNQCSETRPCVGSFDPVVDPPAVVPPSCGDPALPWQGADSSAPCYRRPTRCGDPGAPFQASSAALPCYRARPDPSDPGDPDPVPAAPTQSNRVSHRTNPGGAAAISEGGAIFRDTAPDADQPGRVRIIPCTLPPVVRSDGTVSQTPVVVDQTGC